jgi:ribosome-binding protein aMBF1 (putative translation factor)
LAKAVNEKAGVIHDIENGTAHYDADVINRIEKILGVQIPRGRKNKKKAKKF